MGAPRLQTPALLLSPTAVVFVKRVSSIERNLLLRKITEVTHNVLILFFPRFHDYFFTSNSVVFVGGGAKIFLPPGAYSNQASPLIRLSGYALVALCISLNKIKKL